MTAWTGSSSRSRAHRRKHRIAVEIFPKLATTTRSRQSTRPWRHSCVEHVSDLIDLRGPWTGVAGGGAQVDVTEAVSYAQ